jgi:hypothetical protein
MRRSRIPTPNPQPSSFSPVPFALLLLAAFLLCGCSLPRPQKGGRALTTPTTVGVQQSLLQAENPSAPSRQDQETIRVRTYTLPPATHIEQARILGLIPSYSPHGSHSPASSQKSEIENQNSILVTEREETRAKTELGAAHKDAAREFATKLSSLRGIVWVGLGLFIFGTASLMWPPLKAVLGSVTTSVVITIGGIALMILPTLIVGNEILILGAVGVIVAAWFLAHRHGHLRGLVSAGESAPSAVKSSRPRSAPSIQ